MAEYRREVAWACVLLFSLLVWMAPAGAQETTEFATHVSKLKVKSFVDKKAALIELDELGGLRVRRLFDSLLGGKLYVRKSDKRVLILAEEDGVSSISDAISGEVLGETKKKELKRVVINNAIRSFLRRSIARMSLRAPEPATRQQAVESLMTSLSAENLALLRESLVNETNLEVQQAIRTALAVGSLKSEDASVRAKAARVLSGSVNREVRNRLTALLIHEQDETVRASIAESLDASDRKRSLYAVVETLFFGLSLGSVFVLAAIGLAITFGVMGVINMAHGELIMLGAYTTWVVQQLMPHRIEESLFIAIPAAFLVSALVGVAIERSVVRHLYGRPLETLLATFGISLLLQQAVRTIFSPLNRAVSTPEWMSGQYVVNDALAFTYNRIYIVAFSLLVFLSLTAILRRTTLGLQIRAVSQDRDMARAMGVASGRIDSVTFGLGAGVAGLAGVALSQLTNVGPNLGQSHIVDSFMVVVFGGVGNLWGTLVAGMTLGVSNKLLEPLVGAVLAKICVLLFIVLFIQNRPRGLFPPHGRSAEA